MTTDGSAAMRVVGRYALYGEIASGGMATVHFGRLLGPVGFSRTVAIKRLHPQFAKDPEFVSMFLDEARLAARIRHPNVVPTLDVVATHGELFLVMDYVQGESLSRLIRCVREQRVGIPPRIVTAIISGALHGLHAAHEARDERGEPLGIVHRDISPQNVLVGTDGVPRVLDFGVAKAAGRVQTTRDGQLKGKLAYMAPEQIHGAVTRKTDIYAAAIVAWEALTARRLFNGDNEPVILGKVLNEVVEPPSRHVSAQQAREATAQGLQMLDEVILRGLDRDVTKRWGTAREMAIALERCIGIASASEIGDWVETAARDTLLRRAARIAEIESHSAVTSNPGLSLNEEPAALSRPAPGPVIQGAPQAPHSQSSFNPQRYDRSSSQLSSISLSKTGIPPTGGTRNWPVYAAVGALAVLVASLMGAILVIRSTRPVPSVAAGSSSAAPDHASLVPPPSASLASVAAPPSSAPPRATGVLPDEDSTTAGGGSKAAASALASGSPASGSPPSGSPPARTGDPTGTGGAVAKPRNTAAVKPKECETWRDAKGVKHYTAGCF